MKLKSSLLVISTILGACGGAIVDTPSSLPPSSESAPDASAASGPPSTALPASGTAKSLDGKTFMFIGDSITRGQDEVANVSKTFRGRVYSLLTAAGYSVDFQGSQFLTPSIGGDPHHEGYHGATIQDTINRIPAMLPPSVNPDVIILEIGYNDVFGPPEGITDRYEALVNAIRSAKPAATLILCTLHPARNLTEAQYRAVLRPWADLMDKVRAMANASGSDSIYLADVAVVPFTFGDYYDDIHLSQSGADKFASQVYSALRSTALAASAPAPASTSGPLTVTVAGTSNVTDASAVFSAHVSGAIPAGYLVGAHWSLDLLNWTNTSMSLAGHGAISIPVTGLPPGRLIYWNPFVFDPRTGNGVNAPPVSFSTLSSASAPAPPPPPPPSPAPTAAPGTGPLGVAVIGTSNITNSSAVLSANVVGAVPAGYLFGAHWSLDQLNWTNTAFSPAQSGATSVAATGLPRGRTIYWNPFVFDPITGAGVNAPPVSFIATAGAPSPAPAPTSGALTVAITGTSNITNSSATFSASISGTLPAGFWFGAHWSLDQLNWTNTAFTNAVPGPVSVTATGLPSGRLVYWNPFVFDPRTGLGVNTPPVGFVVAGP